MSANTNKRVSEYYDYLPLSLVLCVNDTWAIGIVM